MCHMDAKRECLVGSDFSGSFICLTLGLSVDGGYLGSTLNVSYLTSSAMGWRGETGVKACR